MSTATPEQQPPAKPNTACLGCRRRKLKCSREQEGCKNCTKADLPCVYPVPETGVKRKRGPYKKDKPQRERHLEHLVKYLEPRNQYVDDTRGAIVFDGECDGLVPANATSQKPSHSEELVKDALIALTKSSTAERASTSGSGPRSPYLPHEPTTSLSSSAPSPHPPPGRIFAYWQLFINRVDPITKILHCPSMAKKIQAAMDHPQQLDSATETLLFSIYYIAIGTCTANEARRKFAENRDALMQRYSRLIESALGANYGMPAFESVQALVIYMVGIRRQDDGASISMLFGLAVRLAQMINLHQDPGTSCKPLEAELRRRLWWHICALESRAAEDLDAKTKSVFEDRNVRFPSNLNDDDLDPKTTEVPKAREGRTEMTPVLLRWESQHLVVRLWGAKKRRGADGQARDLEVIHIEQRHIIEETQKRLENDYIRHLHNTRPLDWLCLAQYEVILIKARMMVDHPYSQVPTKEMGSKERLRLLQSSVAIISITHMLAVDKRAEALHWFVRSYIQWHSLAIVVAELGRIKNKEFTHSAWAVLDPILADWNRLYNRNKDEPAWQHVHALIARARQVRDQAETQTTLQQVAESTPQSLYPLDRASHPAPPHIRQNTLPFGKSPTGFATVPLHGAADMTASQQAHTHYSLDGRQDVQRQALSGAPTALDFNVDFGTFDGLDQIDFQAFDEVFGGDVWEFPSPLEDMIGAEPMQDPSVQVPG